MGHYVLNPIHFLLTTLIELYLMLVLVRFILQLTRADFYNPVSQFVVKMTSPTLVPLRRWIPGWRKIDTASLVLMLLLQSGATLLLLLFNSQPLTLPFILFWSLAELIKTTLNLFIWAIIIQAIISWINPNHHYNPVTAILYSITGPLLNPARAHIPPISGIDFSPLVVILGLEVAKMVLLPPFQYLARF